MWLLLPVLCFLALDVLFPLDAERLNPPASTVVLDQEETLLRAFLAPDEMWRIRVHEAQIPAALKQAVVAYEDRRFYRHPGVDPFAIGRAIWVNIHAGRFLQGGSTLTMQVARLMEPKARTLPNKLVEAIRALQLEWHYSKEAILTFYFNAAPYGGNVVGVGAASHLYFGKDVQRLSAGEAALLAAIPNDPNRYRPDRGAAAARRARDKVLGLMERQGVLSADAAREARSEPVPDTRYELPFEAPHLAVHLTTRYPHAEQLHTTVDARLQHLAASRLKTHLAPLLAQGITNGAIVIIDNATQAVKALVGARDFADEAHQGQVNGALAPRSPGSTLKPFIYALGFDHGLVAPRSLLLDVPVDYAGYRPENYDRTYHGMVAAEDALIGSLNVPAVNLSAALGAEEIYSFLKAAGVTTLAQPSTHYGLSLILGGCEVTLLELTNLYAGLAAGGRFRPYRLLAEEPMRPGEQLLDPGVAYLINEILSQLRRPELPAVWDGSVNLPKVAWKTGTSYGHRDAWSVGYTPRYTVGVWIGNFDGAGVPPLVGAEAAAPLLFDLMNALELQGAGGRWFVQPASVERRPVCAVSGMPATPYCPATRDELYVPGLAPVQPCTMHEQILVDRKTGYRLCSHCRAGRTYREKVVTHWPAEVATWLERNGYPVDPIPAHFPACTRLAPGAPPVIQAPAPEAQYKLRKGVDPKYQQILLDASVSNQTKTIFWFLDGELLSSGLPTERFFLIPRTGRHTLLCVDDEGRSSQVSITIH